MVALTTAVLLGGVYILLRKTADPEMQESDMKSGVKPIISDDVGGKGASAAGARIVGGDIVEPKYVKEKLAEAKKHT